MSETPLVKQDLPALVKGDILYVGNQDNVGIMMLIFARKRGLRAWLIYQKKNILRSDPDYIQESY